MATLKYFVSQALDIATVSEPTIRTATPADAEALHRIYRQPQVLENTGVLPQLSLDQVRNWISGLGQSDYLLVAEEGDAVYASRVSDRRWTCQSILRRIARNSSQLPSSG